MPLSAKKYCTKRAKWGEIVAQNEESDESQQQIDFHPES